MENIFICIITAHIRHGTNQMEGNRISHIVISYIIISCTITTILIVLIILKYFLFYSRDICFYCNIDISHYLKQSSIVSTTYSNIRCSIHYQIITISQGVFAGCQSCACACFIYISKFSNSIRQCCICIVIA